ncbi:MAG: TIGR01777 family oxidoreductase [Flavobacteriales bacterium]|nr:TIGR01777 family oxidoreductase [Flavobacteriales bacterium]
MAKVLITGGTGLIGTALTMALERAGHHVQLLSRAAANKGGNVKRFRWSVQQGTMDPAAWQGVDHVVHLAGAGIADKRWSTTRVNELVDSRAASARLLLRSAKEHGVQLKSFVSASGINYYGAVTSDHVNVETDAPGTDTIGRISREWEAAVDEWATNCRVVKLRTPIVLSRTGGALAKLAAPVRFGLGAALGSGNQWMPWVHLDDLVSAYMAALFDDRYNGVYNVNSGNDVTNAAFMRTTARVLHRPYILPAVPGFVLKLALGELSSILLEGSRASNARLLATGFRFKHPELEAALQDLLRP